MKIYMFLCNKKIDFLIIMIIQYDKIYYNILIGLFAFYDFEHKYKREEEKNSD